MFTVAVTAMTPEDVANLKLVVVSVEFVIAWEKVDDPEEFRAMRVAALAGDVLDTVGGVVSGAAAVVNCQVKLAASALPAASVRAEERRVGKEGRSRRSADH